MIPEDRRIVDLTMELSRETPVFEGYPQPIIHKWTSLKEDGYYSNMIFIVEHTGTHMDSPAHFVEGAPTIDQLSPEKFFGKAVVLDFSGKKPGEAVGEREVDKALAEAGASPGRGWYVFFRFDWDRVRGEQWMRYPYLEDSVAEMLRGLGVEGIGMDSPSPDYAPFNVHKILLPEEIVIVENLSNLASVSGRVFDVVLAPLKIKGGSASPLRVFALL
ncbi:MAG: cyclase family protein [Desulfurococcales archaeon]|nr:cyclase family protein [Desulfurococcales archaeon]